MGAWLCTSSRNTARSEGALLHSSTTERDHRQSAQVSISQHTIDNTGAHTGITNAVRKNETTNEQRYPVVESTPSTRIVRPASVKGEREREDVMQPAKPGASFPESQFYARSSNTPQSKRPDLNGRKAEEVYAVPATNDVVDDLARYKPPTVDDKEMPTHWGKEEKAAPNQELFINESVEINSSSMIRPTRPLSSTTVINPFDRLRPMDMPNKSYQSEDVSLQIFDQCSYPSNPPALHRKTSSESITLNKSLKTSIEQLDDNNDSSTSTTTNRSIHLPVEKQRGLSEIIRKRNSRSKVEDYKRSIQKSSTCDDEPGTMPASRSDQELASLVDNPPESPTDRPSKQLNKAFSVDVPINFQNSSENRAQMSIERLNVLLSNEELRDMSNEADEKKSIVDKRNLFETFLKDTQVGGTLPRSKSFKSEEPAPAVRRLSDESHPPEKENTLTRQEKNGSPPETKPEDETYDDDISKLSFKEKMTLFKKKNITGTPTLATAKPNRSRLTQPITAEEVQAAANLTPPSSSKDLTVAYPEIYEYLMHDPFPLLFDHPYFAFPSVACELNLHVKPLHGFDDSPPSEPPEQENIVPVSKRLEQFKTMGEPEWIKPQKASEKLATPAEQPKSTRKTPTMKYSAKKTNTEQQQRAKTVDIVRLKTGKE